MTWIFTAYLLAASVATPIAGRLGDMFGKKRTLWSSLSASAAARYSPLLATTLPVMIGARAIQGLGGAIFPLAFGIIRDEFPRERVAGGIALISGLLGLGGGLGIILAGPILAHLDYHWLFWIPLVVIALTALATMLIVPESPVRAPGTVDWAGATLLSPWLICLLVAISEAPTWGWLSARTLGLIAVAARRSRSRGSAPRRGRASPLVDMRMMRLRGVWTTNLAGFLLGIGMYSAFVLIPQFVQTPTSNGYGFGSSVTQAGLFLDPEHARDDDRQPAWWPAGREVRVEGSASRRLDHHHARVRSARRSPLSPLADLSRGAATRSRGRFRLRLDGEPDRRGRPRPIRRASRPG